MQILGTFSQKTPFSQNEILALFQNYKPKISKTVARNIMKFYTHNPHILVLELGSNRFITNFLFCSHFFECVPRFFAQKLFFSQIKVQNFSKNWDWVKILVQKLDLHVYQLPNKFLQKICSGFREFWVVVKRIFWLFGALVFQIMLI